MARGVGPRQPRWAKQGFGVGKASDKKAVAQPSTKSKSGPKAAKQTNARVTAAKATKPAKKSAELAAPAAIVPPKSYHPTAPDRVREILKRLDETYPKATCALHHNNAWQLVVATILSAQCTDERVNKTTPELFAKYPGPHELAQMKPEQIEPDIKSTGFFRNKAKSIVGAAKKVIGDFGGEVPQEMEQLLTLPGVARKTANVVLGTWFHKNVGVVVDTHVHRISRRLELTKHDDAGKIEQDLMQIIPQNRWTDYSHEVIWHGRKLCMARNPNCVDCPLEPICHAEDKTWSTVAMHKGASRGD